MAKTNVKAIAEQRAAALKAMDELLTGASAETRALTAEERAGEQNVTIDIIY